jgi:hypothetical protein
VKRTCAIAAVGAIAFGLMTAVAAPQSDLSGAPPYVVDCLQRVESPRDWPPPGWRRHAVKAGPIALFALRSAARAPVDRDDGSVGFETVALVRARRQVTLAVRTPGVELLWGDFHPRRAITFKGCPAKQRSFGDPRHFVGRRTQFIGGVAAPAPVCVAIDIYVLGRRSPYHREFGLGTRCPA